MRPTLNVLSRFLALFRTGLHIGALFLLISFLSSWISNVNQYTLLAQINEKVNQYDAPLIKEIKKAVPYRYDGRDYSKLILIALFLLLAKGFYLMKEKLDLILYRESKEKNYQEWRKQVETSVPQEKLSEIDNKFETLMTTKPSDRKKILKEFAILKSKLDSMGQQLAFLAIDVVDSTEMKRNEDKHIAAFDFDRYNQLVNECLQESGVLKYATTPDGVMSCFRTTDDAVKAAKSLLKRLQQFNRNERMIKSDFNIRCGINSGFVYLDEDTPLEQISDRVIDIAGHMQKFAKPNCINIAASAIEPLKETDGFRETTDIIDEQKVYEWVPHKNN